MVPIATADLVNDNGELPSTDPGASVFPAVDADNRLKKLWSQHGDIRSSTYSNPELTSLAALVRHNARSHPDELAYLVPRDDAFASVSWQQFDYLTEYAALHYSSALRAQIEAALVTGIQPTIALLGSGNTFRYWASQIALIKLGVRVLLLSDKNAEPARDHLLSTCNAVGIVVEQKYVASVHKLDMPVIPFIPVSLAWSPAPLPQYVRFESEDPWNQQVMIIHSSGSTGLPKPIIHTNRSMMLIARMYRLFQSFIVENWYLCFPLFHIAGVSIILGGLPTGLPTSFPPEQWPPSPSSILTAWRKLEAMGRPVDCCHCAPAVIEDLFESMSLSPNQDFSPFTKLKILQPGGAALSPVLLDKLVSIGVNVKTTYGSTEIGPPYRTIPDTNNPSCYRLRYLFPNDPHVKMEPQGENLYECVVYKGFGPAAELWTDPDAPNPYRTNDLFFQDPPNSGLFVLQGRKDDIVVHSNGEKTNALPLQMALEESHPAIHKAVVFGTDKPCTSAVIELADVGQVDQESVFDAISEACKPFPPFSRLDKALVLFLTPGETLPVTPKGNVRRKEALKLYGSRVEALYAQVLDGSAQAPEDAASTILNNVEFVRNCVATVCGVAESDISHTDSFYNVGLDSQNAVRLRSQLARRFGSFPLMFIFEYPSVAALCDKLSSPQETGALTTSEKNVAWIQSAISRYTAEITSWESASSASPADQTAGEVVYLTGATGALGNALLASFATDPSISKVYCAIRGSNPEDRLTQSFRERGYPTEVYTSSKFFPVVYDMKDEKLGLDDETFERLSAEVTAVIHNAWKMDFNQQVDMFEADCLRGTLNLMHFACLKTTKTFAFTSSVATNMGKSAVGKTISETPIMNDPSLALETGYAQSKFIIEIVAQKLAEIHNVPVRMYRVGQLCGHSTLGWWNTTEMFPIMIATGLTHLKAMPSFAQQTVNWLPVDICAESIRTVLTKESLPRYSLHNLVNPAAVPWSQFLDALEQASGIAFERVRMGEWVRRLQNASEEKENVPGARLLGFFEAMVQEEEGESIFENTKTAAMVPALQSSKAVDADLLGLYMEKWKGVGFV